MTEIAAGPADKLDPVWKALSDATRRAILDFLRDRPRTTTEIVESVSALEPLWRDEASRRAAPGASGADARGREAAGELAERSSHPPDL